jgi:hypothetical protein
VSVGGVSSERLYSSTALAKSSGNVIVARFMEFSISPIGDDGEDGETKPIHECGVHRFAA